MKRNMELVRRILLFIEENYKGKPLDEIAIGDCNKKDLLYHLQIMSDSGLISNFEKLIDSTGQVNYSVSGLTWEGHEYLELVRCDDVWSKTINKLEKSGAPKNIKYISEVAGIYINNSISGNYGFF